MDLCLLIQHVTHNTASTIIFMYMCMYIIHAHVICKCKLCMHMCTHRCTCTHLCTYTRAEVFTRAPTHTHTHTHMHTHTHTHTHTHLAAHTITATINSPTHTQTYNGLHRTHTPLHTSTHTQIQSSMHTLTYTIIIKMVKNTQLQHVVNAILRNVINFLVVLCCLQATHRWITQQCNITCLTLYASIYQESK